METLTQFNTLTAGEMINLNGGALVPDILGLTSGAIAGIVNAAQIAASLVSSGAFAAIATIENTTEVVTNLLYDVL